MAEQFLPDEAQSPPAPPANNRVVKMLLWAIIGALLGGLWGVFRYTSEDWLHQAILLAISFGLAGAILSRLIGKGCMT
jgi:hypothetical protein